MPDFTSPNVQNYAIPKANVYFTPVGGERRHIGNVPAANFSMEIERLEHFSAMAGIKIRDFTAVTSKSGTLTLTLEEMTLANLSLALLGSAPTADTDGDFGFDIGAADAITGRVEIIGSNDIGPKYTYDFPSVTFIPTDGVDFISDADDAVQSVQLEGEVNATGTPASFGRATLQDSATA
jgi:hypothetical protein